MGNNQTLTKSNLIRLTDFITKDERQQLEDIAYDLKDKGVLASNPAGPNRFFAKVYGTEHITPFITELGDRIAARFGLQSCEVDPYLGYTISMINPAGFINEHIDKYGDYMNDKRHLRCNVMVCRENETYDPVICHMIVPVPETSAWAFMASESAHGTQEIAGDRARIIFGFGWEVPSDYSFEKFQ